MNLKQMLGKMPIFILCLTALILYAASPADAVISKIQVTNITSSSATISWVSSGTGVGGGVVDFGTTSGNLDQSSSTDQSTTLAGLHHVQVVGLDPETTYFFTVTSDGETSAEQQFTSAADIQPGLPKALFGEIKKADGTTAAAGAIKYVKLRHAAGGESQLLSAVAAADGSWNLALSPLNAALDTPFGIVATDTIVAWAEGGPEGTAPEAEYSANELATSDFQGLPDEVLVIPNRAPVAVDDAYTVAQDNTLTVNAANGVLDNDTDADGDTLTAALVTDVSNGTLTLSTDGSFTYTPDVGFNGQDTFTYTANDGELDSNAATVTITVTPPNAAPVAANDTSSTDEDASTNIAVLNNDSDADGTLDVATVTLVQDATNGAAVANPDGTVTYTPDGDFNGQDTFTYTVNDNLGATSNEATVTVTVNPQPDAPVAVADAYNAVENETLTIAAPGVLGNDTDADGDALTAMLVTDVSSGILALNANGSFDYTPNIGFNGQDSFTYKANDGTTDSNTVTVTFTVAANLPPTAVDDTYTTDEDTPLNVNAPGVLDNDTDPEASPLTAVLDTDVSNGALTLNADGSFTYTPNQDFNGQDSFTYKANDGTANSNTAATVTITVTPVNDAPVAVANAYTTDEDTPLNVNAPGILGNDTDVEGDPLTATLVDNAANGTVTLDADGAFSYTPNADFNGQDTFTYTINDGALDSNTATVTITVNPINDTPSAVDDAYTTDEDMELDVSAPGVLSNDTGLGDGGITVTLGNDVTNGNLTLNANGSFVYMPNAEFSGTDTFTYTVSDVDNETSTATVTITINAVNDSPVAVDNAYTTNEDTTLDVNAPGVLGNDTDAEDDALTATLVDDADNGSLTLNADGSFTYTPNTNFNGADTFTYRANDGNSNSDAATVTITVNPINDPPTAANNTYTVVQNTTLNVAAPGLLANDTDVDGDALSAIKVTDPDDGTLTLNANGSFTYQPAPGFEGTDTFTYRANDGQLNSNTATVTINVTRQVVNVRTLEVNLQATDLQATATIDVSPEDRRGDTDGVPYFTREYNTGVNVTLTAPPQIQVGSRTEVFSHWTVDGENVGTAPSTTITMDADHSATANYVVPLRTLTVNSQPDDISIAVNPTDNASAGSGVTPFTRQYASGVVVTLTAPATSVGRTFVSWELDGQDAGTSLSLTVTMNADHTATALYEVAVRTLTVNSNPAGAAITVSPADNANNADGTTPFTRQYNNGVVVTLTAASTVGDQTFSHWEIDGENAGSEPAVNVTMDANRTATANYVLMTTLTVDSSPSGVPIDVAPADSEGNDDGMTPFSRTYVQATAVTLTAPEMLQREAGMYTFLAWEVDGEVASTTVEVTLEMDADHTAIAQYKKVPEFILAFPEGIGLVHVPIRVSSINREPMELGTVGDLYNALGGTVNVSFLITRDCEASVWRSYLGPESQGTAADRPLTDDLGIISVMKNAVSLRLKGEALGTEGESAIALCQGINLVGVPLNDSRISRVSDLLALEGFEQAVSSIIVTDDGEFKVVAAPGDDGDVPILGGQSYLVTAAAEATATVSGEAWDNIVTITTAPPLAWAGHVVRSSTPVLAISGTVVEETPAQVPLASRFRVTVKNLTTGAMLSGNSDEERTYSVTVVNLTGTPAASVGDVLEVEAHPSSSDVGVQPLRYVITADDVLAGHIQLPNLVSYKIPEKTELLANFPNPFNPETWIPYRLAKDGLVTLRIYDTAGLLVRRIELGHQPAAAYTSKAKAVYWDGRNHAGEQVASGVYFYTLTAGDFTATRKLVVVK